MCYYGFLNPNRQKENLKIDDIKGELINGFGRSSSKNIFKYYR